MRELKGNAREVAWRVLMEVLYRDGFSDLTLKQYLSDEYDKREVDFVRQLVYGVLENNLLLEYHIKRLSSRKIEKIDPEVLTVLKLGLYQLAYLDAVPQSAAVDESVKLTSYIRKKSASGFVNAVLRNFLRRGKDLQEMTELDPMERLSVLYSFPKELVDYFAKQVPISEMETLLKALNRKADLNVRVNRLKLSPDRFFEYLKKEGFRGKQGKLSKYSFAVRGKSLITDSMLFQEGLCSIQEESSVFAVEVLDPLEGSCILDLCAGPGGKTTAIAESMNDRGRVIACDIYPQKLKLISESAKRLGLRTIETECSDATIPRTEFEGIADYVLLDAPCSGFGTIRRKPEIKYRNSISEIRDLSSVQYQMLCVAKNYLKIGGYLVYSTCTLGNSENADQIRRFLSENEDFQWVDFTHSTRGQLQLYPHIHGTDGFFIAKLQKTK